MRCKGIPVSLLDQNRIILALFFSTVVEAERLGAEGLSWWLRSHLDEGTHLMLLLLLLTSEAIFKNLLTSVCQFVSRHNLYKIVIDWFFFFTLKI